MVWVGASMLAGALITSCLSTAMFLILQASRGLLFSIPGSRWSLMR